MSAKRYHFDTDEEYYKAKDKEANDLVMWMHDHYTSGWELWRIVFCISLVANVILLYEVFY
jgi:hypothetical protein